VVEAREGAAAVRAEAIAPMVNPRMPRAGEYEAIVAVLGGAHVEGRRRDAGVERGGVRMDAMPLVRRCVGGA